MNSVKTDDVVVVKTKCRKWLLGAVFSFLIPFLLGGFLAENWSAERGREDVERWSHLVQPSPVPMSEQILAFSIWFVGAGLIAGLVGLLLYYLFTRCRSY
jgi:hypothetical protein